MAGDMTLAARPVAAVAYRARKRRERGTQGMILVGPGNTASRKHGIYGGDLEQAVDARLRELPQYLTAAAFQDAVRITFRRVERSERYGRWLDTLSVAEAATPRRAGGSTPEEIGRHLDDSALRALGVLGLTPGSAAKFAARLEQSLKPDLAQLAAEARLAGFAGGG